MIKDSVDRASLRTAAADWVQRLRSPDCDEADWRAFEGWLQDAPDSRAAFDEAMGIWLSLDRGPRPIVAPLSRAPRPVQAQYAAPAAWAGGALAASLALAVLIAPSLMRPTTSQTTYATGHGERRTVQLADGTRIDLGGGSRLTVRMSKQRREVDLAEGEAAFSVVHDAARPFRVRAADRSIEDLGTEFDVRSRRDQLDVTVRRGSVRVAPAAGAGGEAVSLAVGQRLRHNVGAAGSVVDQVRADDAFAWRQGRLIYRDQSLQAVVEDLNQYFPTPIRLEGGRAASLRFSGVLTLDSEAATVRRLAMLLPLVETSGKDEIVLRSGGGGR